MAKRTAALYFHISFGCLFLVMFSLSEDLEPPYFPPAFLRELSGPWGVCDGISNLLCACQSSAAKCTDEYGLSSIPMFRENISSLLIHGTQHLNFTTGFFDNVRDILNLYIKGGVIYEDDVPVFRSLRKLQVLCLESMTVLSGVLVYDGTLSSLQKVYLSSVSTKSKSRWASIWWRWDSETSTSQLTTLYIGNETCCDDEVGCSFDFCDLEPRTNLRSFVIENSCFKVSDELCNECDLYSLQHLELRGLRLEQFPESNVYPSDCFFPQLSHLILDENDIREIPPFRRLFENVTHLSLNFNRLAEINRDNFNDFPNLTYLSLKLAGIIKQIPIGAIQSPKLKVLNLNPMSYADLDFASGAVDAGLFDGCTNISDLNLEGNNFKDISEIKLRRMLSNLTQLRSLNLAKTQFPPLTRTMFPFLRNVAKLDLGSNKLSDIPDGTFDDLDPLTVLRLDNNDISTISENTFSPQLRHHLVSLNLSHNPFHCDCSLLWFRDWLLYSPGVFDLYNPYSRYICHNLAGTALANWTKNRQQCVLGHHAYVFTVVCVGVLLCTLTTAILVYRYRWHIRLVLYEALHPDRQAVWKRRRPEDFRYDLFVCYDSEDADWVVHQLMPRLEEGSGLRLCVHHRDFIPGKNITSNIVECLAASKRVLAVFSPSFAESPWCNLELELCLSHVVDNNDVMVLVMLEHVPSRDMSGAMLALLKTTTYIEWTDEDEAREAFWRRITVALKNILPAMRQ